MGFLEKIFGNYSEKEIKKIKPIVAKIEALGPQYENLSDEELRGKTQEFKDRLAKGETLDDILPEAYAVVREAASRPNVLNMKHFPVQLMGGIVMHQGRIAEMRTGEGKTLVATLPAYLNALTGEGVHIVTVNDYLAKRDSEWMKPIYDALGISSACILHSTDIADKKEMYKNQIVYITAREAGFDFLRDFVANTPEDCVQTDFDFCIADEADSMMIDEARVPLVIAGETAVKPDEKLPEVYEFVKDFDSSMYEINEELGTIYLTEKGEDKCEELITDGSGLYDEENNELLIRITDCLKACFLLKKDVDYIVKDGNIRIIDEFTGRAAENRRYTGSLQPAVELKEGITCTSRGVIMGVVPMQFYLRRYPLLSGMTGTAKSSEDEFWQL